jgi:tRNA(Ile)-lysidine synthase
MNNWTPLHARLHQILRDRQLLPPQTRLLVAVSGGQDSICLLKLLLDLQSKWGWQLAAVHCDHCWRDDSTANAEFVGQLAKDWQLSFYLETAPEVYASEAAARKWRYEVMGGIALAHDYSYIVTGHTASDRAETLLYNLFRGSGADGLSSLVWSRPFDVSSAGTANAGTGNAGTGNSRVLRLVRPLLEFSRAETGLFCEEQNLPIWEDSTNTNLRYARNRIRLELLPYLQANFNPKVEFNLAKTAELLGAEVEYLEAAARDLLTEAMSVENFKYVNRLILRKAPLALQRRAMRMWLQEQLFINPNFETVEKLTALINAPNRSQTDPFPGGAIARVEHPFILLENHKLPLNN